MKILFLSPYPPFPPHGGGAMRIYQLIRGLAARHEVTCLTFVPDHVAAQALAPLQAICRVLTVAGPEPRTLRQRAWTTLTSPLPDMALRNVSRTYSAALRSLLAEEQFDLIQAESIEMAGYLTRLRDAASGRSAGGIPQVGLAAPGTSINESAANGHATNARHYSLVAPGVQHTKLVLDQFNAEFVLQRRAFVTDMRSLRRCHAAAYSFVQWCKLVRYERAMLRRSDAVVAVSEEDRVTLQRLAPLARIGVVPNGVDTAHFSRAALVTEHIGTLAFRVPVLLFSGTLDFRPNIDALVWFVREVLPRIRAMYRSVHLLVIGKHPTPAIQRLASDGAIQIVGPVRDTRPYIAGADAYIVPLRIGGGVRFKLLEALALEAPVVSTTMGAEGVAGLRHGEHCLLADTPADFADAVLTLLADRSLSQQLGTSGRALVCAQYDWSVIVPKLETFYRQVACASSGSGRRQ